MFPAARCNKPCVASVTGPSVDVGPLTPSEVTMERFVHNANIELYRRLIAESERDPERDEDRHKMLLILLTEEVVKDCKDRKRDG
jgi:hypothetical protein